MVTRRDCLDCDNASGEVADCNNANIIIHYALLTDPALPPETRLGIAIESTDASGGHHLLPWFDARGKILCAGSPRLQPYLFPAVWQPVVGGFDPNLARDVRDVYELLGFDLLGSRRDPLAGYCRECGRTVAPQDDATRVHGFIGGGSFDALLREGSPSCHIWPARRQGVTICQGDEALASILGGQMDFSAGVMSRLMGGADAFRHAYALLQASYLGRSTPA